MIQNQITKSLTDIKLNVKTSSEEFPAETTYQINTIGPKQADKVKNRTCIKSNLKNQIDPKTNYKISYQKISMKHLQQIMFNQISNLISIAKLSPETT